MGIKEDTQLKIDDSCLPIRDNRKSKIDNHKFVGVVLSGLAMSVGWGFRGDYGHEAGAMVPGALLGLAICLASGRQD